MKTKVRKIEIEHYIRLLKEYQWCIGEVYEARLELGDIALEYQPVKSIPTDQVLLENSIRSSTESMYAKMDREEKAMKREMKAQNILNQIYEFIEYIVDPLEKEFVDDLYFKNHMTRQMVANKYHYDVNSLWKRERSIVKKAIIRLKKET